jgi:CRP-like cAMP-binding protein
VILNGCAARFARRSAKLSRRRDIEKIIKIVSFNIDFEKGMREKFSRALTNLFSRGFIGLNQRVQ